MRKRSIILPFLTAVLLLVAQAAPLAVQAAPARVQAAAVPIALKVVGQIGGVSTVSAVAGPLLYSNVGPRVILTDAVALPSLPPTFSPLLAGVPTDIKVANGKVYVALGAGGIAVLDAGTLAVQVQQSTPAPALSLAVGSQRLYVAAGDTGILAYTLTPWALAQTKSMGQYVNSVAVHNLGGTTENLFGSSNVTGSVFRFDISTSAVLGSSPTKTNSLPSANALAVTDSRVYVAGDQDFFTLDANNLGTSSGISHSVSLTFPGYQVTLDDSLTAAYVASQVAGVQVVDITTDTPAFINTVSTAESASSVAVSPVIGSDFFLYIADGRAGLSIAEATVAEPRIVTLTTPNHLRPFPAFAPVVAGTNSRAFAFSNGVPTEDPDLVTVNTSAPAALSVVGTPVALDSPVVFAMVAVTDTSLILSAGANMIVNYPIGTGEPGTPMVVDNPDALVDNALKTVVSGSTAFVADGYGGLATVDLAAMHVTGRFTSTEASDYVNVALAGTTAYVIDQMDNPAGTAGAPMLRVYDVSGTPSELGSATTDALCGAGISASDLVAVGTHVFLACGANGIRVVDVSTPASPTLDATLGAATRGAALSLALEASNLYVAEGATGVEVFSLASNGKVGLGWLTALSGAALSVAVAGNGNVYVATSEAGLEVLQSTPLVTVFLPVVVR